MQICRLTHKTKDITIEKVVTKTITAGDIKRMWRYMYGKLFFDCEFTVEGELEAYDNIKILDMETGITYANPSEASKSAGVSIFTVYNHIHKKIKGKRRNFTYRFKFA